MNKKEQIRDTARLLWHIPKSLHLNCYNDCMEVSEFLYDENYRKQSERANTKSIFTELKTLIDEYIDGLYTTSEFIDIFHELENKYLEEKEP